jgi:hypothetical protein
MLNSEFVRQVTVDRLTDGIDLNRLEAICEAEKAGNLIFYPASKRAKRYS